MAFVSCGCDGRLRATNRARSDVGTSDRWLRARARPDNESGLPVCRTRRKRGRCRGCRPAVGMTLSADAALREKVSIADKTSKRVRVSLDIGPLDIVLKIFTSSCALLISSCSASSQTNRREVRSVLVDLPCYTFQPQHPLPSEKTPTCSISPDKRLI